ncbi:MAG: YihA family ribosome biogenesis GTP-binding protein [Deltaproteobacteria bacterium]|nr:YihA family ribosome biogenesis GTP-binding protein [Deltaproteobacteria bacterium]
MKIKDVQFVKSVFALKDLPDSTCPEIAFSGRSNVGKSSLINTLLNRKGIAKTSSRPGRTQSINYIDVNRELFFVDLPGYGYAKVPLKVKEQWQKLIEGYLVGRENLCLMVQIIDARRDPRDDEARFVDWLDLQGIPYVIILTKIDKLKQNARQKAFKVWKQFLQTENVLLFSAMTGEGKDKVWQSITACLREYP